MTPAALRSARELLALSQSSMAHLLGRSLRTYVRMEAGHSPIYPGDEQLVNDTVIRRKGAAVAANLGLASRAL